MGDVRGRSGAQSDGLRKRIGARGRRRRTWVVGIALASALATLTVGSTGAYFTGTSTTATQTATLATLTQVPSLTAANANSGKAANVSWGAADETGWRPGTSGAVTYTLKRNTVNAFGPSSGATTLAQGAGLSASDTIGGPAVSNTVSKVWAFQKMDANIALIDGVPYRWGLAFRINNVNGTPTDDRTATWAGAAGQADFNTGVPTEMKFTGTAEELIDLAPGRDHACALSVTHKVYCIGFGEPFGQIGNGATSTSTSSTSKTSWDVITDPRGVFTGKTIVQVVSGEYFSCALTDDGTIGCWGFNGSRQLGNADYTANTVGAPVKVAAAGGGDWPLLSKYRATMIAAGAAHVCAVRGTATDGTVAAKPVVCWGTAANNALGSYTTGATAEPREIDNPGDLLSNVKAITAGTDATCVINDQATANIACWGAGGLLGRTAQSSSAPASSGTPAAITTSLKGFSTVDLSNGHACGSAGSTIVCWGQNSLNKLGLSSSVSDYYPPSVVVDPNNALRGVNISSIGTGWSHTCASTALGNIACWGFNNQQQLGQGTSTTSSTNPIILMKDGAAFTPPVSDLLSTGGQRLSQIARIGGSYYQWGEAYGTGVVNSVAVPLSGFPANITKISSGSGNACGITGDSKIYCVGYNQWGQIGDGTTTTRTSAVQVVDTDGVFTGKTLVDVMVASTGTTTACALASDGTLGCWGDGSSGQLTGRSSTTSVKPLLIGTGTTGATPYAAFTGAANQPLRLAGGNKTICATTSTSVVCWGSNFNFKLARTDLATNGTGFTNTPTALSTNVFATGAGDVQVTDSGACALASVDGRIWCWGGPGDATMGGTNGTASASLRTTPGSGWASFGLAAAHICATKPGQMLNCWGDNTSGALGRNTTTNTAGITTQPGAVVDSNLVMTGIDVVSISASATGSCALTSAGAVVCWGQDQLGFTGQARNSTSTSTNVPTVVKVGTTGVVASPTFRCLDGATLVTTNMCSLSPNRAYHYQVTYTVGGADKWVSVARAAARA